MSDYADIDAIVAESMRAWAPPPRLSLSEWAERHYYLSAESAAEPGRWRTLAYQRGIMDAFTDSRVSQVTVMKSARVGWTKIVNAFVGYCMHHTPCPILVVQPTVEDAKGYSKEEIAPMLRDCPELSKIVFEDADDVGPRDSGNTILHKKFPGGVVSLVGSNSGTGFRRVSRRVVLFDEVDAYPSSAGSDGDPIELGIKRSEYYWDRKIGAGSTPLIAGASRIEDLFNQGDQRRYYVPCPHCGHSAPLVFSGDAGHSMAWPDGKPEDAFFACQKNGCVIEHKDKRALVEAGEWRASRAPTEQEKKAGRVHASFHIWEAYSYSPNAKWGDIAARFLEVKGNPEKFKTFVNTTLGETWKERGEAPEWERLYLRRETYAIATAPVGALMLTAGVDVQKDRFVYEVVAWAANKESWSVDAGVIPADTANEAEWSKLDELLGRTYPTSAGLEMPIQCLGVDSGYNTNVVYSWARRHSMLRVIALKGVAGSRTLLGAPSPVDVTTRGKKMTRGYKVWPVGASVAKAELYGFLRLATPKQGEPFPPGYCHFPEHGEDYFKQLTAEHLVSHRDSRGFTRHDWELIPGRENHWLDARVYARAAATAAGLDRARRQPEASPPAPAAELPVAPPEQPQSDERGPLLAPRTGGFLGRGGRGKKWL